MVALIWGLTRLRPKRAMAGKGTNFGTRTDLPCKSWVKLKEHLRLFYLCPMYTLLLSIVGGLFVAMLFVNVYFRAKVLKVYGVLARNKVEFGAAHIFNRQKLEEEILPRYPQFRNEIESFVRHIRYSIKMASVLLALITAFGALLMYFR